MHFSWFVVLWCHLFKHADFFGLHIFPSFLKQKELFHSFFHDLPVQHLDPFANLTAVSCILVVSLLALRSVIRALFSAFSAIILLISFC
jgi:hypothetical protein